MFERAPGTHDQTLGEWSGPYSHRVATQHRLVVETYPEASQVDVRHEVARENKYGYGRVPSDEEGIWFVREAWEIRPEGVHRASERHRNGADERSRSRTKYGELLGGDDGAA